MGNSSRKRQDDSEEWMESPVSRFGNIDQGSRRKLEL